MKTVIIAAGMGSRLWSQSDKIPKCLLPLYNGTILSNIIERFKQIGIKKFGLVVGYKKEIIIDYLKANNNFDVNVEFIYNPDWEKANGISVYKSREFVDGESFLLSMSDHIVSVSALQKIKNADGNCNFLLCDKRIEKIFDIDDATKTLTEEDRIISIGKDLKNYNAIDCGMFKLNESFFYAMEEQIAVGKDSLSSGIQKLIERDNMRAVFMSESDCWIDVDTPEAYDYISKHQI